MTHPTRMEECRYFLKDTVRKTLDFRTTDQSKGLPPPPVQKPVAEDARRVTLLRSEQFQHIRDVSLTEAIRNRESRRKFTNEPLSLEELSFLLWATQGLRGARGDVATFRTVPSAGARHAFETYLYMHRVENLEEGIYRYLPLEHQLVVEFTEEGLAHRISEGCFGQSFAGSAAVTFIWTAIPYRMEWRYGLAAHKVIAIDVGHVAQNLYLACEVIRCGTCAIGAYDQEKMDELLRVDGRDEFTLYIAPVGKR